MTAVAAAGFARCWERMLDGAVAKIAVSPDGCRLAVALAEGPVRVLNAQTGCVEREIAGHALAASDVAWTPDGTRVISCGHDGTAAIWNAHDGSPVAQVEAGAAWVERIAVSPGGTRFATAAGPFVRLWTLDGRLECAWPERSSTVLDLAWRPGKVRPRLAAVSYGAVALYDPAKHERPARELRWQGSSLVIAWRPDGEVLVTGDQDASVHYWIVRTGRDLMMGGYPRKVRELAWDRSGRWLATGGGAEIILWDCAGSPAGTEPKVLDHHAVPLCALAYQPDGDLLASAAVDGGIAVWDPAGSPDPLATAKGETCVSALSWGNGRCVIVGDRSGLVATWRL